MKATRRDWLKQCALSSAFFTVSAVKPLPAHVVSKNEQTSIGGSAAKYGRMLNQLRDLITARTRVTTLRGRRRRFNHYWLRDQVHVMKALKYWEQDLSSMLEFFLEQQTPSGMYWDHAMPLNHTHSRTQIFDPKYWMVCEEEGRLYMRLPVEADCEYLAVEGAYLVWQITGDDSWMMKWLPTLERGLRYCMNDPLRWSKKYQLVKRGYTIDTWDFQQTPPEMEAWGGGRQKVIFDIDENTPMGIMHGDNSGMFAACGQLAEMYQAAGVPRKAEQWKKEAAGFRVRTNETCWNGKYYAHFVEDDPLPDYVKMDPKKSITLSNTYSSNRGLPNHEMAASIIRQYKKMKEEHQGQSFAEWYCMYPPVKPHWAGYEPGTYMNGGITTIVAGELAKAAFQHGYEQYGVDILDRIDGIMKKFDGDLPCVFTPEGEKSGGIPWDWGQAAVVSAIVEGFAGVRELQAGLTQVEIAPRWEAAEIHDADVNIHYPMTGKFVRYVYRWEKERKRLSLDLYGDAQSYRIHLLLPKNITPKSVILGYRELPWRMEQVESSMYAKINIPMGGRKWVAIEY